MKKYTFLLILFASFKLIVSQNCGILLSHSVIPMSVTAGNPMWLNASVYCNSNMMLDHYTVNQTGNSYTVDAYYCAGLLTVISTTNDSFPLGNAVAGNYTYQLNVFTSYQAMSGNCTNYSGTDQGNGSFTVSPTTSVFDINSELFSVFPNPANESVTIKTTGKKIYKVELFSSDGQNTHVVTKTAMENTIELLTRELPSGIYFLKIHVEDGIVTKRLQVL